MATSTPLKVNFIGKQEEEEGQQHQEISEEDKEFLKSVTYQNYKREKLKRMGWLEKNTQWRNAVNEDGKSLMGIYGHHEFMVPSGYNIICFVNVMEREKIESHWTKQLTIHDDVIKPMKTPAIKDYIIDAMRRHEICLWSRKQCTYNNCMAMGPGRIDITDFTARRFGLYADSSPGK